jgi:hypothetical protein
MDLSVTARKAVFGRTAWIWVVTSLFIAVSLQAAPLTQAQRIVPPGRLNIPPPVFRLDALTDKETAISAQGEKRPQFGMSRTLPADVLRRGEWIVNEAGSPVWRLRVEAPGALGLRLHFTHFSAGSGRVWIRDVSDRDQVFGPYDGTGPLSDGDFWSEMIFDGKLDIEYLPSGISIEELPFRISEVFHYWGEAAKADAHVNALTTDCFLDATCFTGQEHIRDIANATVLLLFASGHLCSGTMMNDSDPNTVTPYLLTAGHCIRRQFSAGFDPRHPG